MIDPAMPMFFGGAHHLAGWFTHGLPSGGLRKCAILLCPPVGHEYMCSYRSFRTLARGLAGRGFPVMRFDYSGTGDSADPADDGSLVPVWVDGVSLAADELRHRSGCDRLAFVGLRFGASLAALAASGRDDVDSLVLWSPCTSGRSFVRQTRMLGAASAIRPEDLVPEAEGIESVGFMMDARTIADIAKVNLDVGPPFTINQALVLTRRDGVAEEGILAAMGRDGVDCQELRYDGYSAFMTTPFSAILPKDPIDKIVDWLDERYPQRLPASDAPPEDVSRASASHVGSLRGVRESTVRFADHRLAGVLTEPDSPSDNPAVILMNTGSDHHVGPHRLYTPLARRWAALGFPVLRFDLGGIGDSEADDSVPTIDAYPSTALDDVRAAIDYMRYEKGYAQLILGGICAGAYHAIHAIRASDAEIQAVIAVNPPLYHRAGDPFTPDPYFSDVAEAKRIRSSMRNLAKWRRLIGGRVDIGYTLSVFRRRFHNACAQVSTLAMQLANRERQFDSYDPANLFREGTLVHVIFNEGSREQIFFEYTLAPRLRRLSPPPDVTVDVVPGADHTFMPIRWQRVLVDLMTERLLQHRSTTSQPDIVATARGAQI